MADVAEEVARLYGYNNIPCTLQRGETTRGGYTPEQQLERNLGAVCRSCGYSEIITYSFISPASRQVCVVLHIPPPGGDRNRFAVHAEVQALEDGLHMRSARSICPAALTAWPTSRVKAQLRAVELRVDIVVPGHQGVDLADDGGPPRRTRRSRRSWPLWRRSWARYCAEQARHGGTPETLWFQGRRPSSVME